MFACLVLFDSVVLVRMECPAWCSGGQRPLIAGCLSLQALGVDLPVTRPVWDSNLRPPASESRPFSQQSYQSHQIVERLSCASMDRAYRTRHRAPCSFAALALRKGRYGQISYLQFRKCQIEGLKSQNHCLLSFQHAL